VIGHFSGETGVSVRTVSQLLNGMWERCWELRLGINTRGSISHDRLALPSDGIDYTPAPYLAFFGAMKCVPNDLLAGTFLDYGAGKGRILVLAARYYNFRRVVGVEISQHLCNLAVRNLERAAAEKAQIICCDAATYQPPFDTTVFFFFNPFLGETMKVVVQNIRRSLMDNPRRIALVVCGARNFRAATAGQDWLAERSAGKIMFSSQTWHVFLTRTVEVERVAHLDLP
jgi:SAM-dependent methyltransferase